MSFNSRTRNWKITGGDPSFCNENNIKNSGQFRIRPSVLIHMQNNSLLAHH
uniref:hypothetical protein RF1 n=1 Tax=Sporobolus diandrus TaxID=523331 RepID=UPI002238BEBF|nr:hypothetical protein RF1 [Sporobolus diandrus]YP_010548879.1 hypothetical protein RF1 [Sporobolus diandrus]YP_010548953.1 hypothetical protein RF1 [Sporobolus fertilis]YP_010548966.1 hypothetical protein RF1 [Sporobolus fertilis]UYL25105.1 hypothetical protein RF1 [Sporobolus diandrus]UYL25118.1 hypothetical protein RF1 [Sporobolus diandrus]UYL25192.1 hypothetical protein RF1 [Sporobolus fertilis]UYL25205.1 hypothetical protein RF1 [Sporobolus fertilis]